MALLAGVPLVRGYVLNAFRFPSQNTSLIRVQSKLYSCISAAPSCLYRTTGLCSYGRPLMSTASAGAQHLERSLKHSVLMTSSPFSCVHKHEFHLSAERWGSKLIARTSNFLSKASLADSTTAPTIHNDLSLLIGKRAARRPKVKEAVERDQVMFYQAHAFATAEEYDLEALSKDVKCFGYEVVKLPEDAPDALHIEAKHPASNEHRRIFFFREGSVIFWHVPREEQHVWLQQLRPHQDGSYNLEMVREQGEEMDFTYSEDRTQLKNGDIELRQWSSGDDPMSTRLHMYAFSNALSLSVKLAVWEAMLNQYVDSIEIVLQDMRDGKKIRMSEAEVLRKAGELFTLSHLINLSSDLLDTPDFYWDREDLGRLYNKTCNYLNTPRRTKVMNEKLGQCVEIIELLRDHLKDKHHIRLEWMIIVLIAVEVGFAVFHLIERYYMNDKRS